MFIDTVFSQFRFARLSDQWSSFSPHV